MVTRQIQINICFYESGKGSFSSPNLHGEAIEKKNGDGQ